MRREVQPLAETRVQRRDQCRGWIVAPLANSKRQSRSTCTRCLRYREFRPPWLVVAVVTFRQAVEQEPMEFIGSQIGKPFPQSGDEQLFGELRKFKSLGQSLAGRHYPQGFQIELVVGSWFGIHSNSFRTLIFGIMPTDGEAIPRISCPAY